MTKIVLLLLALGASPAMAQAPAGLPLEPICVAALQNSAVTIPGDHKKLCACAAREVPKRMSQAEIMIVVQSAFAKTPPPNAILSKALFIAAQCLQESP